MHEWVKPFREALEALDRVRAEAVFGEAADARGPLEAVESVVVPALEEIGQAWEAGDLALSQVYMSGRVCEDIVERSLPATDPEKLLQPRVAIVVLSDWHLLGKRIVWSVLRASGIALLDYGRMDVEPLVERVLRDGVDILLVSVLLLPSALQVRKLTNRLHAAGANVRVVVGGAPFRFDEALWREVGADAMGRTAADAVAIVRRLREGRP
jgi:methanogenic corrinoid protein MtbC1